MSSTMTISQEAIDVVVPPPSSLASAGDGGDAFDDEDALGYILGIPFLQDFVIVAAFALGWTVWKRRNLQQKQRPAGSGASGAAGGAASGQRRDASQKKGFGGGRGGPVASNTSPGAWAPATKVGSAAEGARSLTYRPVRALQQQQPEALGPRLGAANVQSQALERQMIEHLQHREFTRALTIYRSVERDLREHNFSEELYSCFVRSAVRVGKADVAERMMRNMKRQGLQPSTEFWQSALKMLSSRKQFSICLSLQSAFSRQVPLDKVVYSCLINAALEVGDPERASSMLERYSEVATGPEDYVLFFRTYATLNDLDAAEATFRRLCSSGEATPMMLNLLLLTCVNLRRAARGLQWLEEAHRLEEEQSKVKVMADEAKLVDVVSYNTLLRGFANDPAQCLRLARKMVAKGIEPDDITFGALLDTAAGERGATSGVSAELMELVTRSSREKDTNMCALLIKSLVRANSVDKALAVFEEMKCGAGTKQEAPDVITYTVLIKALVDRRDLDQALALTEELKAAGNTPDNVVTTHLLEGCRHECRLELGKRLFDELLAAGEQPSEFTLAMMLKLFGRCGAHQEAHDLLAGWPKSRTLQPSVIHFTCLMSGCMRTKSYDLAWSAYELMRSKGIEPDGMALSTLLPGLMAAQNWDRVVEIARVATVRGRSVIPAEMLNSALSQIQAASRPDLADALRLLMTSAGVAATSRAVRRVPFDKSAAAATAVSA